MIVAQDLIKKFAKRTAVDRVSFRVPAGAICGFLGPNGAGKSTSMRMIAGALAPDHGRILIDGADVWTESRSTRADIGWLPEQAPVQLDACVEEFIQWSARMKGVKKNSAAQLAHDAMRLCSLLDVRQRLCGELSRGFRQRVGLAAALSSRPKVLLLDEPISNLDTKSSDNLIRNILSLKKTIIIISHKKTKYDNYDKIYKFINNKIICEK